MRECGGCGRGRARRTAEGQRQTKTSPKVRRWPRRRAGRKRTAAQQNEMKQKGGGQTKRKATPGATRILRGPRKKATRPETEATPSEALFNASHRRKATRARVKNGARGAGKPKRRGAEGPAARAQGSNKDGRRAAETGIKGKKRAQGG